MVSNPKNNGRLAGNTIIPARPQKSNICPIRAATIWRVLACVRSARLPVIIDSIVGKLVAMAAKVTARLLNGIVAA